jgi:hypothetical protein
MYTHMIEQHIVAQSPCFYFPFASLYLLGTLLAVIGSRPPWSQVARKLISPFPSPPHSLPNPKSRPPWGFPSQMCALLRRHRKTGLQVQNSLDARQYCTPLCDEISATTVVLLTQARGLGNQEEEVKCSLVAQDMCCCQNVSGVN